MYWLNPWPANSQQYHLLLLISSISITILFIITLGIFNLHQHLHHHHRHSMTSSFSSLCMSLVLPSSMSQWLQFLISMFFPWLFWCYDYIDFSDYIARFFWLYSQKKILQKLSHLFLSGSLLASVTLHPALLFSSIIDYHDQSGSIWSSWQWHWWRWKWEWEWWRRWPERTIMMTMMMKMRMGTMMT